MLRLTQYDRNRASTVTLFLNFCKSQKHVYICRKLFDDVWWLSAKMLKVLIGNPVTYLKKARFQITVRGSTRCCNPHDEESNITGKMVTVRIADGKTPVMTR